MKKNDFTRAINDEMTSQFRDVGMDKAYWCGMHAVFEAIRTSASYDEIKKDQVVLTYHEVCAISQKLYDLVMDDLFI